MKLFHAQLNDNNVTPYHWASRNLERPNTEVPWSMDWFPMKWNDARRPCILNNHGNPSTWVIIKAECYSMHHMGWDCTCLDSTVQAHRRLCIRELLRYWFVTFCLCDWNVNLHSSVQHTMTTCDALANQLMWYGTGIREHITAHSSFNSYHFENAIAWCVIT